MAADKIHVDEQLSVSPISQICNLRLELVVTFSTQYTVSSTTSILAFLKDNSDYSLHNFDYMYKFSLV